MSEIGVAVTDSYLFLTGGSDGTKFYKTVYSLALPPPTAPALTPQRLGTNGAFQVQFTSSTNIGFGIAASTNLADWDRLGWGFTDTNGCLFFQDTNAASFPSRFYHAFWPLP